MELDQTVERRDRGKHFRYGKHFNLEHIYRLAKALEVEMCELLDGDESLAGVV